MKKLWLLVTIILCMSWMVGCGAGEVETPVNPTEYMVIDAKQETLATPAEKTESWKRLSMQYVQGELVQFWAVKTVNDALQSCLDIYLYHEDGTTELIMSNVATKYNGTWFMDEAGCYYLLSGSEIIKLDSAGAVQYRKVINDGYVNDICQLPGGELMLLVSTQDGGEMLCRMDAAEGTIIVKGNVELEDDIYQYITADADGLLLMDSKGVWRVNTEDGSRTVVLDFVEQVYNLEEMVEDFKVLEDGSVEVAQWIGMLERLSLVDIKDSKVVITVRDNSFQPDMANYAAQFNASNDKYFVVLEEREEGTDLRDFRERTAVEIGTGGGPDLISQDVLLDAESLMEKGILVDMSTYMERSGMREEDFFPPAFDFWRKGDAVYGMNMLNMPKGLWMSKELLGENDSPTMEELVDALLAYPEKAMFKTAWESEQVLDYFLVSSGDLWGMIDWEKNTCDFSGELFAKMLKAAKEFGFDPKKDYAALTEFSFDSFYKFQTKEQLASEGKVYVGYIFEDGCYPAVNQTGVMAMNGNSDEAHRDGAWAFIEFLLSEEIQSTVRIGNYCVRKESFRAIAAREIEEGAFVRYEDEYGKTITQIKTAQDVWAEMRDEEAFEAIYNLTQEKVDAIQVMLESCRGLPAGTASIRTIIWEEAANYFSGSKSIEEVVKVIENRVQLFLEERK